MKRNKRVAEPVELQIASLLRARSRSSSESQPKQTGFFVVMGCFFSLSERHKV